MEKLVFHVKRMDCPTEEQLIRMKLDSLPFIESLSFDLPGRRVTVLHSGQSRDIESALHVLDLDSRLIESEPDGGDSVAEAVQQRKILAAVLAINLGFFFIEILTGLLAGSMGLVADSLDMLADALVYGLSLFAVGASNVRKKRVAGLSGYMQLSLALIGFGEVLRRFLGDDLPPDYSIMIVVSVFALTGNSVCLYLLQRSKSQEAHIKASMIFTSNDIIINVGVICAGMLVMWLESALPDLIIGTIVFLVVIRGAARILRLAR